MNKLTLTLSLIGTVALASPSAADLQVRFIEGAPKDRFSLTNVGGCALGAGLFEIDFEDSSAGLIFDVSGAGAGVEVYQPFEVTAGAEYLTEQPVITDGDQRAMLALSGLGVNETIAFTIDVDDTKGARAITVTRNELSGTIFSFYQSDDTYSGVVSDQAGVMLDTPNCVL